MALEGVGQGAIETAVDEEADGDFVVNLVIDLQSGGAAGAHGPAPGSTQSARGAAEHGEAAGDSVGDARAAEVGRKPGSQRRENDAEQLPEGEGEGAEEAKEGRDELDHKEEEEEEEGEKRGLVWLAREGGDDEKAGFEEQDVHVDFGGESSFARLDADTFRAVCRHLEAPDVARFSATCHSLHDRLADKSLWQELLERDWFPQRPQSAPDGVMPSDWDSPRTAYASRMRARTDRLDTKARRLRQEAARIALHRASLRCRKALDCYHIPIMLLAFPVLAIVCLILIEQDLKHGDGTRSWLTLWPMWLFAAMLTIDITISCWARHRNAADRSIWGFQWDREASFTKCCTTMAIGRAFYSRAHALLLLGLVLLQPVLIALKLSGHDMLWPLVFIPSYIVFLMVCCIPCMYRTNAVNHHVGVGICVTISSIVLLTIVLISIKLSGVSMSLAAAFTPLWILEAALLLLTTGLCGYGIWVGMRVGHMREARAGVAALVLACVLLVPLIVFEIWLSVLDNVGYDKAPWGWVFTPIILFMTYALIAAAALAARNTIQARRRQREMAAQL